MFRISFLKEMIDKSSPDKLDKNLHKIIFCQYPQGLRETQKIISKILKLI